MKFYNRKEELQYLSEIIEKSNLNSQMTIVVGRRRIGKTRLILKALEKEIFLYFFVAKKEEKLLCEEFVLQIKEKLNIPVFGGISKFKDLFALLMAASKGQRINLVIDEFQEFSTINNSVYSDMQNIWDVNKNQSRMNLIVSGSVYFIMKKIFENSKEPLFGRANERISLKPFDINALKCILKENNNSFTNKDLLAFYIFTGGVPKYVETFVDKKTLTYEEMLNEIFKNNSYFIDEGKNILIEEFGKEYSTYFSILALIASSKTSRVEIESILEKNIGGYLDRLENDYSLIKKVKPVFAKQGSRINKYYIEDNFLNFWFRFIYKNRSAVEIGNFDYLKAIVNRDFETFSGKFLEKYFVDKLSISKQFSLIGNYWEKGNKNEVDIIAINQIEMKAMFAEVKINKEKNSIQKLKNKSEKLIMKLQNYSFEYKAFSIDDM
ncbi:MAG: ATP-binding protein [Bacteroidales bacterium]|nr:ATP-binding protein [Bacteroidales bacterium]MBN2757274.1 ATP-binding protein [Bacteroidales bacterium]